MLKSLCSHELCVVIVIIVVVIICDQFSYTPTIFLAKTRLIHSDDDDTYKIPGFEVSCRNDQLWNQTTRPPHRLISYVRDTSQILGQETQTSQNCESIFLGVQHSYLPISVQLISIYLSPQYPYVYFTKKFDELMKEYYDVTYPMIIMGDFKMKSITGLEHDYNAKLEKYMRDNFNFKQIVKEDTSIYQSVLDLCFTNENVEYSFIWNFWSDHKIVAAALDLKVGNLLIK